MNFAKRINSEYKKIKENPTPGIQMQPTDLNIFEWDCIIQAAADSPYKNKSFKVKLLLPKDYPLHPPKAKFVSRIFHPNIHFTTGDVCLDILKSKWSPIWSLDVYSILNT